MKDKYWDKLKEEVILQGLCTQCGSCVGLSEGLLGFKEARGIPFPKRIKSDISLKKEAYEACPARYCDYVSLNEFVFSQKPKNWLCGVVHNSYIGFSKDENIRRNGASGGIITTLAVNLLESGLVDGVICLKLGNTQPYSAEPVIAKTVDEILICSQSVYSLTPVNTILSKLKNLSGDFAYVGMPDQIASIRKLQKFGHKDALKIKYIMGPYMGTQMYFDAIRNFVISRGYKSEDNIVDLKYRAGEWPGYLRIELDDGKVIKLSKFYYNYLIPMYITSSSLQLVDFTSELADISVGDAWSPKYESLGGGYSVVLSRTERGDKILEKLKLENKIDISKIEIDEALNMHGHMLDFKKRGSFIRMSWKKSSPEYGYKPKDIAYNRIFIEYIIYYIFKFGKLSVLRKIINQIPMFIIGPFFNGLRMAWKNISKPSKRKGLSEMEFEYT